MWNPFSKSKYEYKLGIDIGTTSLKVVELLHAHDGIYLNNYAQFFSEVNYVTSQAGSFDILDSRVANILDRMFASAKFQTRAASMALPVFSSFSTLIDIPAMPEEELDTAVRFEARKYIPLPIKEVQFDWIKVDHLSNDEHFKILTVAVPNEIIEKYNRIADMVDIKLQNIELETFSTARSLVDSSPEPIAVLDVGSRTTDVSIVDAGTVVMHHNIDSGGSKFVRVLARGLAIDNARAQELKKSSGIKDSDDQVSDLLRPSIDKVILEVEQMFEDYIREGGRKVGKVIITGGEANMPGLREYIEESMHITTEMGNPFRALKVPPELEGVLGPNASEFAVAIGLALR